MRDVLILIVVGLLSGAVNAFAGGGSLISFPVLIALGLPPLTANVTNTVGQLPGYASITYGYREQLKGQRNRLVKLAVPAALGAVAGVVLLKLGGRGTFDAIVPALVLLACGLLAAGPRIRAWVEARREPSDTLSVPLILGVAAGCAYASYFGAAAGVLILAILGIGISDTLQRLNGLNRALVLLVNVVALPAFILLAPIDWGYVAALAPATLVGGYLGAKYASGLDDRILRAVVITLGIAIAIWLIVR
jgi:uncharacterized membrane protein YfcA